VLGGKGEHPLDRERVRAELSGSEIEAAFDAVAAMRPPEDGGGDDLAHLAGEQTHGYFRDMVFAQTYAEENRRRLVEQVLALAGVDGAAVEERIVSTHNYVDFDDLVVRKGATRAREGERLVVPFNMAEGTVVCEGLGNDDWNHSAPHGAGRRGSRRWAHEELDHEAAVAELAARGIHATNVPADEIPAAYKDPDLVAEAMTDSVRVVDELTPLLNAKGQ
jgi:tRNA-splicing ligase RtcB